MQNFRGIREGQLDDLFPLTILVGRNNSGKSTCLEAILLAHGPDTVAFVLKQRGWFGMASAESAIPREGTTISTLWDGDVGASAQLGDIVSHSGKETVQLAPVVPLGKDLAKDARDKGLEPPLAQVNIVQQIGSSSHTSKLVLDRTAQTWLLTDSGFQARASRQVVFFSADVPPSDLVTALGTIDAKGEIAHQALLKTLRTVDPELRDIRLISRHGEFIPHAVYDNVSVPLAVIGDGIKRLYYTAAQLSSLQGGIALLEEPECFQHPRSLVEFVRVLWSAVDDGVQVILSTHSLELIDLLRQEATAGERSKSLGLFRLGLRDGRLEAVRIACSDLDVLRDDLLEDVRR